MNKIGKGTKVSWLAGSRMKAKLKQWRIEYEIPPLRAIYHAEADATTEQQVRELIKQQQPLWQIRKIKENTMLDMPG